jgi:hypothetical protein
VATATGWAVLFHYKNGPVTGSNTHTVQEAGDVVEEFRGVVIVAVETGAGAAEVD